MKNLNSRIGLSVFIFMVQSLLYAVIVNMLSTPDSVPMEVTDYYFTIPFYALLVLFSWHFAGWFFPPAD